MISREPIDLSIGRPFLEARMLHEVAVNMDDDNPPPRRGRRPAR